MRYLALAGLVLAATGLSAHAQPRTPFAAPVATCKPTPTPFADNNGCIPPNYPRPLFRLSHDYPAQLSPPPPDPPWRRAINNGPITVGNAGAYTNALKQYVAEDMRRMLTDSPQWNPQMLGWYNEPWTGWIREATHGMYSGSTFPLQLFRGSGLRKPFTTYVLTFYDRRSAHSLYNVWGETATTPKIELGVPQFAEGSVIVKAAFSTANSDAWPVMQGALQWTLYISTNATKDRDEKAPPELDPTSFFQFDIIVKDSQSAPQTGWVFSTLVYDKDASGADFWDKMVPLGAMWGNDPQATSPGQLLMQTWINPAAPAYSKMTLGWGGRLSGPNDGAVNDAVIDGPTPVVSPGLPSSSCMSCHSVAEWPMKSFLLPVAPVNNPMSYPPPPPGFQNPDSDYLIMWPPGSAAALGGTPQWMNWFQSRSGTEPADPGTVAFDYDMVFTFKSLRYWQSVQPSTRAAPLAESAAAGARPAPPEGSYSGRPFGGR